MSTVRKKLPNDDITNTIFWLQLRLLNDSYISSWLVPLAKPKILLVHSFFMPLQLLMMIRFHLRHVRNRYIMDKFKYIKLDLNVTRFNLLVV